MSVTDMNTLPKTARSLHQYLSTHAEAEAIAAARALRQAVPERHWRYGVIIPVCGEDDDLLERIFAQCLASSGGATATHVLAVICLNRPDEHPRAEYWQQRNRDWLEAQKKAASRVIHCATGVYWLEFNDQPDALVLVRNDSGSEATRPIPRQQGVGLARKLAADCLLELMVSGTVSEPWLFSTDADARLPAAYFDSINNLPAGVVALSLPFEHRWHGSMSENSDRGSAKQGPQAIHTAQRYYDLRLHLYRVGIELINPAYAWTALGSALIVSAAAYAQVRGFPRRAAGEDFYLLNKLAKVGAIRSDATERPGRKVETGDGRAGIDRSSDDLPVSPCNPLPVITLGSRFSDRVPFGTGPAVESIAALPDPQRQYGFYHPEIFLALAHWRQGVCQWLAAETSGMPLSGHLQQHGAEDSAVEPSLVSAMLEKSLPVADFIDKLTRQRVNAQQRLRQFDEWLDAFRLLKAVHALETLFPRLSLPALAQNPNFQRHFLPRKAVKKAFHDLWPIA